MENGYYVLADGRKVELPEGICVLKSGDIPTEAVEVYVPKSVVVIEEGCFHGSDVQKVRFSDGSKLRIIANNAFDGCNDLKEINFPWFLKYIGTCAFSQTALEMVNLGETQVEYIGDGAFANCSKLIKVELPYSLKMVPPVCFYNCRQLMKINLNDNVKFIASEAFGCCDDLTKLEGNTRFEYIGEGNYALKALLDD